MAISVIIGKQGTSTFYMDRGVTVLLKLVSCIAIVMHHYSQYALTNGVQSNWLFRAFSSHGGYVGVALFFFLSGYGLAKSNQSHHLSLVGFLKHRLSKVYIPVMLVTLLWCPFYLWLIGTEAGPLELIWQAMGGGGVSASLIM